MRTVLSAVAAVAIGFALVVLFSGCASPNGNTQEAFPWHGQITDETGTPIAVPTD